MVDEYVDTFVDLSATPYRYACYTSAYTSLGPVAELS